MFSRFKEKYPGAWQLVKYAAMGLIASAVELAVFSLCNYAVFAAQKAVPFRLWIFDYGEADGGLCFFLSLAVSFVAAQIVNYVVQRKITFHAAGNTVGKTAAYAAMMAGIFILQLWLPSALRAPFAAAIGENAAELALKLIGMFLGFAITYPINKFVIMKNA